MIGYCVTVGFRLSVYGYLYWLFTDYGLVLRGIVHLTCDLLLNVLV